MRSSDRARSGCAACRRPRTAAPFFENCASEAGYFWNSRNHPFQRAREPVGSPRTRRAQAPPPASTRSRHGFCPWVFQARCRPATVPGTPTAMWLLWWTSKSYLPSIEQHRRRWTPAGAISRKSKRRRMPVRRAVDEEAAAADVAGGGMRDRQRERGRDRGVDRRCLRHRSRRQPTWEAMSLCDTTMPRVARAGVDPACMDSVKATSASGSSRKVRREGIFRTPSGSSRPGAGQRGSQRVVGARPRGRAGQETTVPGCRGAGGAKVLTSARVPRVPRVPQSGQSAQSARVPVSECPR